MAQKVTIEGSNHLETVNDDWGGVNNTSSTVMVYGPPVPANTEWGMNRGEVERFAKQTWIAP